MDEPGSSKNGHDSILEPVNVSSDEEGGEDDLLDRFRTKWKSELDQKKTKTKKQVSFAEDESNSVSSSRSESISRSGSEIRTGNIEEEAKFWFEEGVILEQKGKLYEAVSCYRKATQLVPDIEFKLYRKMAGKVITGEAGELPKESKLPRTKDETGTDGFIEYFSSLLIDENNEFMICESDNSNIDCHISKLPFELLIHVLKWVVSSHLDLRSLEQVSLVCRGMYLLARDPEIWRMSCIKIWGSQIVQQYVSMYQNNYRSMYLFKPRVNFHGIYISRTTYLRFGESSFQDVNYKPVHLVEYYRYMRFFSNGTCLMMTTPDEPVICIPKMRQIQESESIKLQFSDNRNQASILQGIFWLNDNSVSSVFKKVTKEQINVENRSRRNKTSYSYNSKNSSNYITTEQVFNLELEIKSGKNKRNNQLSWLKYSVCYNKSTSNNAMTTTAMTSEFNVLNQNHKYPPFWFSRVKSYHSYTDEILE